MNAEGHEKTRRRILGRVEIIEPHPAIYIPEIDTIAISDLHLGYEGVMAEAEGLFIPKVQFGKEMSMLEKIVGSQKARRILVNGDIKHEFSETSYHESREVSELLYFLENNFEEVILVKGNHDNFIARVTSQHMVRLCDEFETNGFHFLHGHKTPTDFGTKKAEVVIIGHEHAAIALHDELGVKEKLSCFLYGKMTDGRGIIVLPPFSYFAQGSEINLIPKDELLSPILREFVNIDELEVVGISEETGCLEFPRLGFLRKFG